MFLFSVILYPRIKCNVKSFMTEEHFKLMSSELLDRMIEVADASENAHDDIVVTDTNLESPDLNNYNNYLSERLEWLLCLE